MNFKAGDRVRQIIFNESYNELATIVKINGNQVYHIHDGTDFVQTCCLYTDMNRCCFELVKRQESKTFGIVKFCKENYK